MTDTTREPAALYLLCGLPFSGKSTLALALATWRGPRALLVVTDAVNAARGVGLNGAAISPEEWEVTYAEVYRRVDAGLRAGRDVIFDDPNFLRAQRNHCRVIAGRSRARVTLIYVTTPERVARERLERNRSAGLRVDVRDEDFAQLVHEFEAPGPDEGALLYDGVEAPGAWLARMEGALLGKSGVRKA